MDRLQSAADFESAGSRQFCQGRRTRCQLFLPVEHLSSNSMFFRKSVNVASASAGAGTSLALTLVVYFTFCNQARIPLGQRETAARWGGRLLDAPNSWAAQRLR